MKKYRIKILHSVYLLFITLLVCGNVSGAVKIINKTDISLRLIGDYEDNNGTRWSDNVVEKGEQVSLGWTDYSRRYDGDQGAYRLKNMMLYIPDNMNEPIVRVSANSMDIYFMMIGRLILNRGQYPEVDIDGKKVKLMVVSNCFGKTRKVTCKLIIEKYNKR